MHANISADFDKEAKKDKADEVEDSGMMRQWDDASVGFCGAEMLHADAEDDLRLIQEQLQQFRE